MSPSENEAVKIARLETRLNGNEANIQRNEQNIERLYGKIDVVDGKVERLTGRFDVVDNKIDGLGSTLSTKIDTLSGIVLDTKHCLDRHIDDSNKKEVENAKETTIMSTKQKAYYGIAVLILGALASGIISIVVHFIQRGT